MEDRIEATIKETILQLNLDLIGATVADRDGVKLVLKIARDVVHDLETALIFEDDAEMSEFQKAQIVMAMDKTWRYIGKLTK